jgi:hypothetical protein
MTPSGLRELSFSLGGRVRYIDAEGRILEEPDTTVAECVEDANEEGFSREDLDQAAGGDLKAYIRKAIAKAGHVIPPGMVRIRPGVSSFRISPNFHAIAYVDL